jgi:CheY-like chemotaxis protein
MKNKKPLVLVVDDDESVRALLQRQMELDGYRVASAGDGASGVKKADEEVPDIVLLDALMPGMDGFQVAEILKASEQTSTVPIIMVTALNDQESKLRALKAGAQEFLTKPIDATRSRCGFGTCSCSGSTAPFSLIKTVSSGKWWRNAPNKS